MIKLVRKDLKLFFINKRAMMLTFALPIILTTLFAYVFGGYGRDKTIIKTYDLTVSDMDSTASSRFVISKLNDQKILNVVQEPLPVAQDAIKKGKINAVLIIHKGFADSLVHSKPLPVEIQYDEANEAQTWVLMQAIRPMLSFINVSNNKASAQKGMAMVAPPNQASGKGDAAEIKMSKILRSDNNNSLGLIQAVAGIAIMMLLFSVGNMGASMHDEKQEGTLKKLLYSPMRSYNILIGKMVYVNIIAITQLSIMFIYSQLVFGLDCIHHLPAIILMIIATAYACTSFGVFLASFTKSRQQVAGLSTLIVLVMSCIGGSMIPVFAMPELMQKISVVSVNYWGIQGFYDIFWRQLPFNDPTFLSKVAVLIPIGTVLNLSALNLFRKNILNIA
jgi:ABC-type multidrug transport system permease subunit